MAEPTTSPLADPSILQADLGLMDVAEQKPTILKQGERQVAQIVAEVAPNEVAKVAASADNAGVKVGGAIDLGDRFSAGGHVERRYGGGWGWFVGGVKRWFRK